MHIDIERANAAAFERSRQFALNKRTIENSGGFFLCGQFGVAGVLGRLRYSSPTLRYQAHKMPNLYSYRVLIYESNPWRVRP